MAVTPVSAAATPSLGSAVSSPENKKGAMGKNEFLKLLVAQLKHQDPLNPAQGDQMAAQLAQFSSVEQLQNINATLTAGGASQGAVLTALNTSAAMGTLGKTVVAASDQLAVPTGTDPKGIQVIARVQGAGTATLSITDANGTVVGTRKLGAVGAGELTVPLGDAGAGLAPGTYHYTIDVTGPTGTPVGVTTYTMAKVERVQATASGPVLIAGGMTIPFGTVTEIRN